MLKSLQRQVSYTYTEAQELVDNSGALSSELRIVITTVRDSLDSWVSFEHTFIRLT